VGNSATSVKLQYKLSTDSVYTDSLLSLTASSNSGTITSLVDATSYNIRLEYIISGVTYHSNVVTATTL